jgi:hypothetical protein
MRTKPREDRVPDPIDALILDLLEWIGPRSRPYADVMDAWRTSCPRLTVWEDATERGLVESSVHDDGGRVVYVTARGRELLASRGRGSA